MKTDYESSLPSPQALSFVQESVKDLRPEIPDYYELHQGYVRNHIMRITFDFELVERYATKSSRILEFGSVPLLLTAPLTRAGFHLTGVDIAPERYKSAIESAGLSVVKCDIETSRLPFEANRFDLITFFELFEHLRVNPIFTIGEAIRVLKPGGILLLSTPNLRSLAGLANFLVHGRAYSCSGDMYEEYRKLERLGHMGHVREYTTVEVTDFFRRMGMELESLIYRGRYYRWYQRPLIRLFPALRPFVSYAFRKPG
jgi:SAM-dependent methyltransferase